MNRAFTKEYFFTGRFLFDKRIAIIIWFGLALAGVLQAFAENGLNNYFIYKQVFFHSLHQTDLYQPYPSEYGDVNLYGPFFSLVIAPFALLPDKIGAVCWVLANAGFLFWAISKLPLENKWKALLLILCSHELMISSASLQTNPLICGCIIVSFSFIQKQKEAYALFFIMLATFIKLYGIVGLAFFFFSKKPFQFILWMILWSIILFFSPLMITNFSFLFQSYKDWLHALRIKSAKNVLMDSSSLYQNVSVPGMIRRIFYLPGLNDLLVIIPAIVLFLSQYLKFNYFNDIRLRLYILCSVLISTTIFSTGSESSTYIIAMPGICIWYFLQPKTKWVNIFFIALFLLTTFAYSDIFTAWSRHHLFRPYSLKALPSFILWIVILVQIHRKQFLKALDIFPKQKNETAALS